MTRKYQKKQPLLQYLYFGQVFVFCTLINSGQLLFQPMYMFGQIFSGQSLLTPCLKKNIRPVLVNMNLLTLLTACANNLMDSLLFLENLFQTHPDSVILQKYQSLSNQSFKHNSAHMTSLNLTPKPSFELSFCMFIINFYYTKRILCYYYYYYNCYHNY